MDVPQITGLPEKIIETVSAGKRENREFFVSSANNLHIKGLVYTNHTRVMVENASFGGLRNRISYLVDASFLEDGDVISGALWQESNRKQHSGCLIIRILRKRFLCRISISAPFTTG